MQSRDDLEIFLVVPPGLESVLADEVRARGFGAADIATGGVTIRGGWPEVWRANLELRGASRVLVRFAQFPAVHLSQLDKKARKLAWGDVLRADVPVTVEASCRKSKLYHAGAVAERVGNAITATLGAPSGERGVRVMARVDNNLCTISLDTSGDLLHRRGFKAAVAKAPMRETLAALFLQACGFRGTEPVFDPMCGSGTFVIEAAEMAAGLKPGWARRFAFEQLKPFDANAWDAMRSAGPATPAAFGFAGSDRDAGAITAAQANADRAGVAGWTTFTQGAAANAVPPDGPAGLVMVNPPYGARIGNRKALLGVYHGLGHALRGNFAGWRVGLVTSDDALARATRLPFGAPSRAIDHGGIRIRLYQTRPLAG
jgi:putative N6-adenine-specific DNA methylase